MCFLGMSLCFRDFWGLFENSGVCGVLGVFLCFVLFFAIPWHSERPARFCSCFNPMPSRFRHSTSRLKCPVSQVPINSVSRRNLSSKNAF